MSNFALSNSTVGRAAVLTSPPAISRNAASVLPIARRGSVRQSVRVGPAVGAFLAVAIDRVLLGEPRWRFGLGSLLSAMTLAALSLGAISGFAFR